MLFNQRLTENKRGRWLPAGEDKWDGKLNYSFLFTSLEQAEKAYLAEEWKLEKQDPAGSGERREAKANGIWVLNYLFVFIHLLVVFPSL